MQVPAELGQLTCRETLDGLGPRDALRAGLEDELDPAVRREAR